MPTAANQQPGGEPVHGEDASVAVATAPSPLEPPAAFGMIGARDVSAEEAAAIAEAEAAVTKLPPIASQVRALKTNRAAAEVRLAAAAGNPDPAVHPPRVSKSERSLLAELRDRRRELEEAEAANAQAQERLTAAREVYDHCAQLLAGYTPLETRLAAQRRVEAGGRVDLEEGSVDMLGQSGAESIANIDGSAAALAPQAQPEEEVVPPTNDVHLPEQYQSTGEMDAGMLASFRDGFYRNLTKNQSGAAEIDEWQPPKSNANLKSRAQLDEWVHIATHWNTGADGMDAGAFRAKHKTWYSKMKPASYHLGRRTGIHLRQTNAGETVLCRYHKSGTKSIVYLAVPRLFDALFQIHAVELNHRGRDATKNLADERYANVPDATVRAFLDACPVCAARKGQGQGPVLPPQYHQPTGV
ncbi:hypothetical protein ACHAXT_011434 [Thalassiosira profunda]